MGFINCNKLNMTPVYSSTCSVKGIKYLSAKGFLTVPCSFKGIKSLSAKGFLIVPSMIAFFLCSLGQKDRANVVNHETNNNNNNNNNNLFLKRIFLTPKCALQCQIIITYN